MKALSAITKKGRLNCSALAAVFLLAVFMPSANAAPPAGYYLVWGDDFSGSSLDATKWDYWLLGNRRDAVNVTNAVAVTGGNLVISTYTSNSVNYTAIVATDQTFRTKYGYWESNIKWSDSNGMWSAVWMQSPTMGANINDPFTSGSEIDIAEHRKTDGTSDISNVIQPNVHWNGYGADAASSGGNNYGSGLATGFHTYGFLWTPTDYTISIDGGNVRNWNYAVNGVPVSRSSEWMIFSSEVQNGSWAGSIPSGGYGTAAVSPVKMTIDYARYYAPTTSLFWTGASSLAWSNSVNWVSNLTLTAASDVTFSFLSGNNLATTLGKDLAIDSLTVLEINNGLSISSNTLTIGAGGIDAISANHSVSLNSTIALGAAQTWQVGSSFPINMNGNLTGANSLTKANAGTLNLNASNGYTGTLFVDANNTTGILSDGMVVVAHSNALANAASPIQIRNNNNCSSTLGFSGGGIRLAQNIQMVCRNNTVPLLENLYGTNFVLGNVFISSGGSNAVIQCDAGQFNIAGNIAYNGGLVGNRLWNFISTGTNIVSGVISNSSNGSVISLNQGSAGMLVLSNANLFTGDTHIASGTLRLAHTNALQASTLNMDASDTGTLSFGPLTSANFPAISGSRNLALTNAANAAVALNLTGAGTYAGTLTGSGSLTKSGGGVFTLVNTNTYTGATILNGGTLKLARDPLVKFSFDNVSGSANGSIVTNNGSGGSALNGVIVTNNGTGANGASFVAGKVGNALSLAGDGTLISINNRVTSLDGSTAGVNWTLALWLKTSQPGAGFAYQGDGGWGANNTVFYLNQGNTSAGTRVGAVRYGGGWLTGTAGVNDGNWHFIAIADAGGTKSIYVDGNLDATTTGWANASAGNQFWIGGTADNGDGVADFNGQLDEVSIYNRALSQTEIRSLTNALPALTAGNFGGQLPSATVLSISSGAIFDLGGNSQTIVSLGDSSGGGIVTNSGAAAVTLAISGTGASKTFSGVIADGATTNAISLVKNGAATETLAGTNTYRGPTTVNAGTLLVNGRIGTNTVTVASGKLGGSGVIGGAVTATFGSLAPGNNAVGILTVSNNVTLQANSTTFIELDKSSVTNDLLRVTGTLNYGGTLSVANLNGTLAPGDSFKIFDAPGYNGSFAAFSLPALGVGLAWNTDALTNGTISIVATLPPQFSAIVQTGDGNFQFNGSGSAGVSYELDAATNLLLPVFWLYVTNAVAGQDGLFQFFDPQATNFSQRFYRIQSAQ